MSKPTRYFIAVVRDGHRWVFLFDDKSAEELLRTLGRYASDPDLRFSWYDAARLSQRVRRMMKDLA